MKHFRKPRLWVLLALVCLLSLCLVVGCTNESADPSDTHAATQADSESATETAALTEAETQPETVPETVPETIPETIPETVPETVPETGWTPDTGVFNEGKVTYEKGDDGVITATPAEGHTLGLDITDKTDLVSICYTTWFDAIFDEDSVMYNISDIEAGLQDWGPVNYFHYWGKPAEGYYSSTDKTVIRKHMNQLYTAGVDFIIIDATFLGDESVGNGWWNIYTKNPCVAICEVMMEMRAEGLGTPYMVFWLGTNRQGNLFTRAIADFFSQDKWKDCFVYWDNKPFVLTWGDIDDDWKFHDQLTVRTMRGLQAEPAADEWSFLTYDSWGKYAVGPDGTPEQVTVSVASQQTYMSLPTADGRQGGVRWFKQWYNAFEIRPKIVTLTWWNEWTAQRTPVDLGNEIEYHFTDNYNQEYSRDIEPMEGGHGDQYYQWLIQYISAYKGGLDCPMLVEENYVRMANRWLNNLD